MLALLREQSFTTLPVKFHGYAVWAQFPESKIYGEKFKPLVHGQKDSDEQEQNNTKKNPKDEVIEGDLGGFQDDLFKKQ